MSKHLTEEDLLNELFQFEKAEAATIEQNGPGRWGFIGWNAPKDGKISRPIGWVPSREAWEARADKEQAPYRDGSYYKNDEKEISGEVSSPDESVSRNAPRSRRTGKSSAAQRDGFDFDVVTI